jgi:hypothetical protein
MVLAWLMDSFDAGPKAQAGPERCTRSPSQSAWATISAPAYAVIALVNRTSRCTALTRSTPDLRSAAVHKGRTVFAALSGQRSPRAARTLPPIWRGDRDLAGASVGGAERGILRASG